MAMHTWMREFGEDRSSSEAQNLAAIHNRERNQGFAGLRGGGLADAESYNGKEGLGHFVARWNPLSTCWPMRSERKRSFFQELSAELAERSCWCSNSLIVKLDTDGDMYYHFLMSKLVTVRFEIEG